MAQPVDLRTGLANNLRGINTAGGLDWQVSEYVLDAPTPPCVYIAGGPVAWDKTMGRAHDDWTYTVYAMVGYVSDIGAQLVLDTMLASAGPTSIKALVETDRTLGGAAYSLRVTETTGARVYTLAGPGQSAPVIGAEWTVLVMASGTT